ncbi:hypothetical protein SAY87_028262 [Trapa incisa]|uniref:Uncharacterized protein n=1 Tax=Trapa incisa TaxID=236973 RepID=A0AAN7KZH2_9MYRT|nr:hypothetical protein SAY87_028262 [Trapa incisa]
MSDIPMISSAVSSGPLRQQPSRLQRRPPASLRIASLVLHWNVAIPLLSPVASSSTPTKLIHHPEAARPREVLLPQPESKNVLAAPFCSDPPPMKFSVLPV